MHATAQVCPAYADTCRLRPKRAYKDEKPPAEGFPQLIGLLSCTNTRIMEAEPCPLDDRRSASEVSLKLAVVHLTTMTAYCHLLSMRGAPAKIIFKKMIVFFIFPGSIIIQHVIAILAIVSTVVLVQFKTPLDSASLQSSLKRAPSILFGAIDQHPLDPRPQSSNEQGTLKIMGRIIVVLALGAQCVGSCVVFARRYRHDAATIADWRVLELAIAALLICLLTVVHLLWHPALRTTSDKILQQSHDSHLTYLDRILLHARGMPAPVDSGSSKYTQSRWWRQISEHCFRVPTFLGAYWMLPEHAREVALFSVKNLTFGGFVGKLSMNAGLSPACDSCSSSLSLEIMACWFQAMFLVLVIFCSATTVRELLALGFPGEFMPVRWWSILLWLLIFFPLSVLFVGLASVLCGLVLLGELLPLWIFAVFGQQMINLVFQLLRLEYWPTDQECPLLWSDPNANVLWHLM